MSKKEVQISQEDLSIEAAQKLDSINVKVLVEQD